MYNFAAVNVLVLQDYYIFEEPHASGISRLSSSSRSSPPPIERIASATDRRCAASASTCRSLATISSGLCLFLDIDPSSFGSREPYLREDRFSGGRPKFDLVIKGGEASIPLGRLVPSATVGLRPPL